MKLAKKSVFAVYRTTKTSYIARMKDPAWTNKSQTNDIREHASRKGCSPFVIRGTKTA